MNLGSGLMIWGSRFKFKDSKVVRMCSRGLRTRQYDLEVYFKYAISS